MTDLDQDNPVWNDFVQRACDALGVPAAHVDIRAIHELARDVAHNVDRPLAPVSTFILGMAVGAADSSEQAMADDECRELLARVAGVAAP